MNPASTSSTSGSAAWPKRRCRSAACSARPSTPSSKLQLENLQDGDRFYYLTRTQGQNFLNSLEQNSFAKMIMANTNLAQPGPDGIRGTADDIVPRHIGVDSFAAYDFVLEVNAANQADYNGAAPGVDPDGQRPDHSRRSA